MLENNSLYGNFRQLYFTQVYEDSTKFLEDYKGIGIPATITDASATTLYYLLYSSYGNSTVASSDINRFKYKLFSIIFQYGPTWEKKLEIQNKLRELTDEEIREGSKDIYNRALNPATAPTTDTTEELQYINEQNTTKRKRNKIDAYAYYWSMLKDDITKNFLNKFRELFLTIVQPEEPLWYDTEKENEQ